MSSEQRRLYRQGDMQIVASPRPGRRDDLHWQIEVVDPLTGEVTDTFTLWGTFALNEYARVSQWEPWRES